ncbi:MAG: PAS domain S-box protein [Chloroflexaceae bacterium]|nr:PAS domain S-box protein [Chloroflexaceae bacterium]
MDSQSSVALQANDDSHQQRIHELEQQVAQLQVQLKETQKHLEQPQRDTLFRVIFDSAGVGLAVIDTAGRMTAINRRAADMAGYTPDELVGTFCSKVIHPADRSLFNHYLAAFLRDEPVEDRLEIRHLHKDGSILWVSARWQPCVMDMAR